MGRTNALFFQRFPYVARIFELVVGRSGGGGGGGRRRTAACLKDLGATEEEVFLLSFTDGFERRVVVGRERSFHDGRGFTSQHRLG